MIRVHKLPIEYDPTNEKQYDNIINELNNNSRWDLIIGEVQSGKTRAIIELVKKSLDNKFDRIIVLGGFNKFLYDQTISRFKKEFKNLTINTSISELDEQKSDKRLCILLKSSNEMKKMNEYINNILNVNNLKIIIIDDESDYASINTNDINDPSLINECIMNSYENIKKVKCGGLISITATPYSNILTQKNKSEINSAYILNKNINYTGLNFFNNYPNCQFYISVDKFKKNTNDMNEWQIVLCVWIIKSYLYFNDPFSNQKSDLLIYYSDNLIDHNTCSNNVKDILKKFSNLPKNEIKPKFEKIISLLNLDIEIDSFMNWLSNALDKFILDTPLIFNSDNDKNYLFNEYDNDTYKMKIIISGSYLSRGFTFKNLLVEYFTFVPNSVGYVDTLLQRCRWFGYRKENNRDKYMNVITTDKIIELLKIAEKYNNVFNFCDDIHYENINRLREKILKISNEYKKLLEPTNYEKK